MPLNQLVSKLIHVFDFFSIRELLTPQQHYDWGLRALKTVLRSSGNLLKLCKRSRAAAGDQVQISATEEANLVVQASRINTLSKLTFADSKRFDALIADIFPDVLFKDIEYESLAEAVRQVSACQALRRAPGTVLFSHWNFSFVGRSRTKSGAD